MQHFIGQGKYRLNLFEWLLTSYDPSIFDGLKGDSQQQQEDKIVIALKQIGIVNYNDRRGAGINHHLLKSVQALNGFNDSVQLLYRLTQFVIHSNQV